MLCDSVPKDLPAGLLSQHTKSDVYIDHKGATIQTSVDYIQQMGKESRDGLLIHTGTNHVMNESEDEILRKLRRLETNLVVHQPKHVAISSIVHRKGPASVMRKVIGLNKAIKDMCRQNSWQYVDNDAIDWQCLDGNVHLTGQGMLRLMNNFASTMQTFTKVQTTLTQ